MGDLSRILRKVIQESAILIDVFSRKAQMRGHLVGNEFEQPPDINGYGLRLHMFAEIVSAQDFPGSNVYVRYVLDIPSSWKLDPDFPCEDGENPLAGITQVSSHLYVKEQRTFIAHFGLPIETVMLANPEAGNRNFKSHESGIFLSSYVL